MEDAAEVNDDKGPPKCSASANGEAEVTQRTEAEGTKDEDNVEDEDVERSQKVETSEDVAKVEEKAVVEEEKAVAEEDKLEEKTVVAEEKTDEEEKVVEEKVVEEKVIEEKVIEEKVIEEKVIEEKVEEEKVEEDEKLAEKKVEVEDKLLEEEKVEETTVVTQEDKVNDKETDSLETEEKISAEVPQPVDPVDGKLEETKSTPEDEASEDTPSDQAGEEQIQLAEPEEQETLKDEGEEEKDRPKDEGEARERPKDEGEEAEKVEVNGENTTPIDEEKAKEQMQKLAELEAALAPFSAPETKVELPETAEEVAPEQTGEQRRSQSRTAGTAVAFPAAKGADTAEARQAAKVSHEKREKQAAKEEAKERGLRAWRSKSREKKRSREKRDEKKRSRKRSRRRSGTPRGKTCAKSPKRKAKSPKSPKRSVSKRRKSPSRRRPSRRRSSKARRRDPRSPLPRRTRPAAKPKRSTSSGARRARRNSREKKRRAKSSSSSPPRAKRKLSPPTVKRKVEEPRRRKTPPPSSSASPPPKKAAPKPKPPAPSPVKAVKVAKTAPVKKTITKKTQKKLGSNSSTSPARPDIKKAAEPEAPAPAAKGTKKTTKEAKVIESKEKSKTPSSVNKEKVEKAKAAPAPAVPKESKPEKAAQSKAPPRAKASATKAKATKPAAKAAATAESTKAVPEKAKSRLAHQLAFTGGPMHLRHPNSVAHVRLLVRAPWKRYVVAAFFVAYYACSFKLWSDTVGQPHQWALDEQKRLIKGKAEAAKEKGLSFTSGQQDRKETELELDEESLPSQYMPGAFACVFIFLNIVVHVLFHLMCVWSVAFRALFLFQPARRVHPGSFVRVTPHANKGKADICLVHESEVTLNCHFKFQYQNFEFVEAGTEDPDLLGDVETPGIRLIQCPTNQPWRSYRDSKGLATSGQVELAQDKYGSNIFDLPKPTFMQLYQKQLISPLVIFQLFSAALWVMDTFWRYTCFTLGTILMFEASTVFQRLKSMATLRGMSTKSFNVFVYRCGKWEDRPIEELLPGDLISLHTKAEEQKQVAPLADGEKPPEKKETLVPCDCLIIDGSAIVNEATLTGESVPQMKDAMAHGSDPEILVDCFGTHRIHSLFSGTSLIQTTAPERPKKTNNLADPKSPPDDGIICFVLRTGFNSSQGELMRMIEFSTESVGADVVETALQLAFLLVFALVAAGYVMKKASEDPTRPTYKTLIRCTQIITSVVPPSLPMQMAFAVNTALMSLLKSGIYCTEPFRVPYAGRVSHCFFDKTGTLTSDQMVAVGIVNAGGGDKAPKVAAVKDANTMACVVLAGCHSLIEVESKLLGDPIEVAALRSIAWSYQPSSSTASPSNWRAKEITIARQKEYMAGLKDDIESDKKEKEEVSKKIQDLEKSLKADKVEAGKLTVAIKHRFHFSSDLQRMSTICKVTCATDKCQSGVYGLVKGSPEAIAKLLQEKPSWYDSAYKSMAEQGQRVLALAYTRIVDTSDLGNKPREEVESHLTFAGFIAFKCETRKDSMLVIRSLQDSSHACVMLTGDARLTALSVAVEVGIAQFSPNNALVLTEVGEDGLEWRPAITSGANGDKVEPVKFEAAGIRKLGESRDLIITGGPLERAWQQGDTQTMQAQLSSVKIFARLSPFQKEQIIQAVRKSEKSYSFMCGDGGNDVGALKEADVGLALLSGFGNANVDAKNQEEQKADVGKAEDALEAVRKENQQKAQEIMQKSKVEMERKRKDLVSKQQEWIQEELEKRKARGEDVGVMAQFSAMKSVMGRLQAEMKKEQELQQKKHGTAFAAGAAKWAEGLDSMEDTPMVQLGDASTAAPFTTRTPSISSVVDIIRQGRCTLLSAVQQMQMMMLESMIAAYTMSTMSVDGTRPSEPQMMASGVFVGIASLAFSFARPLDRMHPVRPLSSVFHPANLFSMLGQLAIHLVCMVYIANLAKEVMGEEAVRDIIEFEKERNKRIEAMTEEEMSEWNWFSSVPFKNNLLNTCCWLVETAQQVSVIFVNYKGRPWMKGLLENQPLFLSLFVCIGMVAVCAWGVVPFLNSTLNLEVVPEELRMKVIWTLLASLVGTFIWDRLMVALCAPHIMAAQLEEAKATTWKDFLPLLQTAGMILGGGLLFVSGNPLLWGGAFMMYRNWKKTTDAAKPSAS